MNGEEDFSFIKKNKKNKKVLCGPLYKIPLTNMNIHQKGGKVVYVQHITFHKPIDLTSTTLSRHDAPIADSQHQTEDRNRDGLLKL